MKADVDPFPFVPAICMRFKRLKSSGYTFNVSKVSLVFCGRCPYLVPYLLSPPDHLRYSLLILAPSGLAYGFNYSEVGLQSVEGGHRILVTVNG